MQRLAAVLFVIVALLANFAMADELPRLSRMENTPTYGPAVPGAKASRDTIMLMGPHRSDATWSYFGDFQDAAGAGAWNDWTHLDLTDESESKWSASDYNATGLNGHPAGNLAGWCGWMYAPCSASDEVGGYGNQWYSWIEYSYTVPDTNVATSVELDFWANYDMEWQLYAGTAYFWDVIWIVQWYPDPEGDGHVVHELGGRSINDHVVVNMDYEANGYYFDENDARNQVYVWILVNSDIWTSDEECQGIDYWFGGKGAIQLDDLAITITNGAGVPFVDSHDFEDGTLGNWVEDFDANAVGDFVNLRSNLNDLDVCHSNGTTQVNFVDTGFYTNDGLDPQPGLTYTYGPGGYQVQNQGGLTFDESYHLHNVVRSPIMGWPDPSHDGASMGIDFYMHEELSDVSAGVIVQMKMRSTSSADPADIELVGFKDDGYLYYQDIPIYFRRNWVMSELLVQGRQHIQIQIDCHEVGYAFGYDGVDGTPAPYFDNVTMRTFPVAGPSFYMRNGDRAQDTFPTIGTIDTENLGANSCRFDMANDVSNIATFVDPGDSLVAQIVPVRTGSTLAGAPRMYFKLKSNPIFDAYRTDAPSNNYVEGWESAPGYFAFDLPDSNFLFPGDELRYYFEGVDDLNGDQVASILPADTTGFSDFNSNQVYPSDFIFRALPSLREDGIGGYTQPELLFWNDFSNYGGENEWHYSLNNLGLLPGRDYDTYMTMDCDAGLGNGLGSRATTSLLEGYNDLLYTCGNNSVFTISNGDGTNNGDKGDDVGVLTSWFELGGKDAFLTGDSLVNDLATAGGLTTFLTTFVGVDIQSDDLRPLIGQQTAPLVMCVPGDPVFVNVDQWIAYGGCNLVNTFDAVYVAAGGTRLAEFTNASGSPDSYEYSAATLFPNATYQSRVISMPYDFMYVYTDPNESAGKSPASLSARARVLSDILTYFGVPLNPGDATPVPGAAKFAVRNYPNPFNPTCKIEFNMPKAGHLSVKVYNVRGELVATLVDGAREVGPGFVMWDGTNDSGAAQASGVYFYEARAAGDVRINKMALVK